MTTSTDNLATAETILDSVRDQERRGRLDATASIQLASAYLGLAAIKVSAETLATVRAELEKEY